ncbi:MAG: hypothetical protein ACRDQ0_04345 [Pseudonocardia sp.]
MDVSGHLLAEARLLRRRFAHTAPQPWDAVTASGELSVQLGHLALCLLRHRDSSTVEWDDPARPLSEIGDELADVLLAILSICALTDTDPLPDAGPPTGDSDSGDAYLRLVMACGRLSEAALVKLGYRHQPEGRPPSIARDAGVALRCCAALADRLDLDLLAEFTTMAADAHAFLDRQGTP